MARRVGGPTIPVLLVWGAEGALVLPAVVELLPDGRLHALPGYGRSPALEKPAECATPFAPPLR